MLENTPQDDHAGDEGETSGPDAPATPESATEEAVASVAASESAPASRARTTTTTRTRSSRRRSTTAAAPSDREDASADATPGHGAPQDAAADDAAQGETPTTGPERTPEKRTEKRTSGPKKTKTTVSGTATTQDPTTPTEEGASSSDADSSASAEKATSSSAKKKASGGKKESSGGKKKASGGTKGTSDGTKKPPSKAGAPTEAAAPAADAEAAPPSTQATDGPDGLVEPGTAAGPGAVPLFQAPEPVSDPPAGTEASSRTGDETTDAGEDDQGDESADEDRSGDSGGGGRRRRRRGGRRRRKGSGDGQDQSGSDAGDDPGSADAGSKPSHGGQGGAGSPAGQESEGGSGEGTERSEDVDGEGGGSRRRRRRRRAGENGQGGGDDPEKTVTKVRKSRSAEDEITAVTGSTRLEAKKQRRREGREAGRRRAPIVSEAEFLARRESVERVMVIREREDLTQIAVLEDKVLVEHYVARESQTSLIGNVYLGRVQNVLPSMEAAFIDIGKGRNAVLYAGEVNWQALGHQDGQPRKIESVLSSGQTVLVQVTKDPVGHKGARLTSQVSLPGRFLVYVPDGTTSGISRKLPDTERARLKALLKEIVPDTAGVIVRTAAEGASEEELTRDVERLRARWEDIEKKSKGSAPQLLYGEPDLTLKVVRDLFTEDFARLVVEGDAAWDTVQGYVSHVAPDLEDRLERYTPQDGLSVFAAYRIDEQIAKGLDRKVWLPSGGSLIIDRTEAMTVIDVNTGKFTGSGGNLEETVTKNNLEAAEEIVRQLRLRDIGGIVVVDFIDMVLESNRDLVLRRLVECLGRDRTRHQVAEVTSLGLVQMTRKRIGTGLLEAFSETCEHCAGRGLLVRDHPVDPKGGGEADGGARRGRRRGGGKGRGDGSGSPGNGGSGSQGSGNQGSGNQGSGNQGSGDGNGGAGGRAPSPKEFAAMARSDRSEPAGDEGPDEPAPDSQHGDEPPSDTRPPEASAQDGAATAAPAAAAPEPSGPGQSGSEPSGSEQSGSGQSDEEHVEAGAAPPEPAAPVVTRTRRRRASRPAGPPSPATDDAGGTGGVGTPPRHGAVEPGTVEGVEPGPGGTSDPASGSSPVPAVEEADDEAAASAEDAPPVTHVPVKKRGSRKR
jgi:ribonuclease E